eukprot:scaffold836_cov77-Skeletonema_dohrnii-CCMP3373.AAC.3
MGALSWLYDKDDPSVFRIMGLGRIRGAALKWLKDNPSVEEAEAFIENHPVALMGIYDYYGRMLLHYAILYRVSEEVILLLLKACPQAAAKKDEDGRLPLHYAINDVDGDGDTACSEKVIKALLNAHPGAASERNPRTGNLLLHDAVNNKKISEGIILSLLNAYPQAAFEKMKDGRLLVEIFLKRERKASDDLMREICKVRVRVDGLLPLGVVLTKRSSDDVVLAVIEAYPEAAGKRFSTNCDECILPLHIAYEDKHSEKVRKALLDAYPGAAEKENPFETTHQLHTFLENKPLDCAAVEDLIEEYPEAVGKRGRDGRLPLHIAIGRNAPPGFTKMLFNKYPQAGKEKMKDGRLPIEVIAEQKKKDGWSKKNLAIMVTRLLENDMPVRIEDGTPVEHSSSWHACISYSTKTATDAVRRVLLDSEKKWVRGSKDRGGGFGKHIHALADARDAKGRTALGLAAEESREVIYDYLLFCGRYKLQIGFPEHRTATSVVLRAQDLGEQAGYGVIFDNADKDESGKLDKEELEPIAFSIGLDPDLFFKGSEESDESISKEKFVSICKRQLGDGPREVVIKLMKNKDQWERECNARKKYELDPNHVVSALPNVPSETEIAGAVRNGKGGLDIIREKYLKGIEVGEHAFVMEAGNRNLHQMFFQEQPKLDDVRVILRQVFEAVQHLHKEKLMHGDIKMLNIVRFRIDNGLRLIDLDASAAIMPVGEVDEKKTFAGAKFSSAILPPEMIERIEPGDVEAFKKYWKVQNDNDLDKKVAPKIYKDQGTVKGHYVVKSFRTGLDGTPVYDGLPYKLVPASESIDLWSLGVLAFNLLTGETLIPSTRDDDCASGAAMHLIKSWGTQPEVLDEVFNKIEDEAGRDLVWKLLQKEPGKRKTVATHLATHPFFNPKMSASTEDQFRDMNDSLQNLSNQVEILNANILEVKKLSIESKDELLHTRHVLHHTRHVLLKGIFEATEVKTPTTFIILNNKLPPAADPSDEEAKNKILEIVANEDGSGVSMKTKGASVTFSADGANIDLKGDLKEHYERVQDGITWAERLRKIGTNFAAGEIGTAFETIKEGIQDLIVGDEMYLYLVDELTGEPVEAKGWPLTITTPSETVPRLIPLMQVGMRVISICNGAAGLAKVFGIPAPRVPKDWSKGARDSVKLFEQDSSVQEFGVVHAEVKGGTQENTSVRGASLREFQDFMKKNDPGLKEGKSGNFAGLQRIGDPEEGTALWTTLTDQSAIESALKERKKQREEEERKQDLNRRQEEMAELKVVRQEETIEETSGMEEVHSSTGEFAKRNDTRNVLAASEEIDELEATAAATGSVCCTIM